MFIPGSTAIDLSINAVFGTNVTLLPGTTRISIAADDEFSPTTMTWCLYHPG
jgi:hypothetical protein